MNNLKVFKLLSILFVNDSFHLYCRKLDLIVITVLFYILFRDILDYF